MKNCNIAIVGAGTAGLAVALFLNRDGHRVTLFEQFAAPKPLGAGLMLQPTGLACLANLDLDTTVIANSRKISRIDGRTLAGRSVLDIGYQELGPHAFGLGTPRSALFDTLHRAVLNDGIELRTSTTVRTASLGHHCRTLVDENNTSLGSFDCVIDASGARSHLRSQHAEIRSVRPYPFGAVWGVCEEPADWPWPDVLSQRFDSARHMLGVLPLGTREGDTRATMAFFWSLPTDTYPDWRRDGMEAWHPKIDAYWPEAGPLARQFTSPDDLTLATYPDVVLERLYGDRIAFLGDAAHSTSPQLGQGANLALADAFIFSRSVRTSLDMNTALSTFATARKAHLRFYQVASRYLTPFFQSQSRTAGALRDVTFGPMTAVPYLRREMVRSLAGVKNGIFSSLNPGDWHERYGGMRL